MLGLPIMHCSNPNINLGLSFLRININTSTRYWKPRNNPSIFDRMQNFNVKHSVINYFNNKIIIVRVPPRCDKHYVCCWFTFTHTDRNVCVRTCDMPGTTDDTASLHYIDYSHSFDRSPVSFIHKLVVKFVFLFIVCSVQYEWYK